MASSQIPTDAPPSYETATTGSSSTPNPPIRRVSTDGPASRTPRNGIPPEHRRSMEDEHRPLPAGWVRQFDPIEQHQFFVDTRSDPPRSIWTHPYDDPDFLATLPPDQRKEHGRMHRTMTLEDVAAESSDDESQPKSALPPRPGAGAGPGAASASGQPTGIHKFTRKMKDKITSTTHEQRQQSRNLRAEQEQQAYQLHLQLRQAMIRAIQTGQPQFAFKDRQGRDVYIEPPGGPRAPSGAYGYNPYNQGPYGDPNARFVRPRQPYGRPYGYGYGGGVGVPVAAGLLGGALLGSAFF